MFSLIIIFMLGAAFGSFSLVLAWRLHDKRDWVSGKSACESCGHNLAPVDLVPVFSWLVLRGKCRYCKKRIPKSVFWAEFGLGATFAVSWLFWPFELIDPIDYCLIAAWFASCVILSALFWYDLRWYILPTKLIYVLLAPAAVFTILRANDKLSWSYGVLWAVAAALLLWGLFFILFTVSKGKWIGFGDVRLAIPLGLLLGSPVLTWLMLFAASCLGLAIALPGLLSGRKRLKTKIPFGPMLISATVLTVIWGEQIVSGYLNFIGL